MPEALALDVAALRGDFPILSRQVGTGALTYLDSANTSQKPRQVVVPQATDVIQGDDKLIVFGETKSIDSLG